MITIEEMTEEINQLRAVNKSLSDRNEDLRGLLKSATKDSEDLNILVDHLLSLYQEGEDIPGHLILKIQFESVKMDCTNQRIKKELDL